MIRCQKPWWKYTHKCNAKECSTLTVRFTISIYQNFMRGFIRLWFIKISLVGISPKAFPSYNFDWTALNSDGLRVICHIMQNYYLQSIFESISAPRDKYSRTICIFMMWFEGNLSLIPKNVPKCHTRALNFWLQTDKYWILSSGVWGDLVFQAFGLQ